MGAASAAEALRRREGELRDLQRLVGVRRGWVAVRRRQPPRVPQVLEREGKHAEASELREHIARAGAPQSGGGAAGRAPPQHPRAFDATKVTDEMRADAAAAGCACGVCVCVCVCV